MFTSLSSRQIIVGITGGIAAYKAAELVRRLQDHGATVRVIMTKAATEFITPLTLQALSGHPVHIDLLDPEAEAGMGHIQLARWADLVVVAPASADFMARLAGGRGDDLLGTVCLATKAPVALAPAMNQAMWGNTATQDNLRTLQARGIRFLGPDTGLQACGDTGPGRLLEVPMLLEGIAGLFSTGLMSGLRVVITAGPTREAIDPVRYISNHSSGKMGYALARACADAGAITTLISGPVSLPAPDKVRRINVTSAADMLHAAMAESTHCDIFIAAAAVADYRPAQVARQKMKKEGQSAPVIELVMNPDIVATVAAQEAAPFVVGFAAETEALEEHARNKMQRKKLDMIIANDVSNSEIGFNSDDNAVTVFWQQEKRTFGQMSKQQLSKQLIELIAACHKNQHDNQNRKKQ